jgi:hypothetical protein
MPLNLSLAANRTNEDHYLVIGTEYLMGFVI